MNRSVLSPSSIIRVPSSTLIIPSLLGLIHKIFLELRFYFVYGENFFNRIQSPSNCNSFSLTSILHRLAVFHVEEQTVRPFQVLSIKWTKELCSGEIQASSKVYCP